MSEATDHDPFQPHSHEPNPAPPTPDPAFLLRRPDGSHVTLAPNDLRQLPSTTVPNCYIVSTGHGTTGPFAFTGVRLLDVLEHYVPDDWSEVVVISADGFGNRVWASELQTPDPAGPILLSYAIDGRPMSREEGLVRLVVPSETDDALRQVKWVGEIRVE